MSVRVKYILPAMTWMKPQAAGFEVGSVFEWEDTLVIHEANCEEYDWLVVYDDLPKKDVGSIHREMEKLACPKEQTILVTAEPPTIKLYPECYTKQFGYVLTTHDACYLPHRNYRLGRGTLRWIADYTREEVLQEPRFEKSKTISVCCSSKAMKHTQHYNRMQLIHHVAKHMPELDWYGWGVKPLKKKYEALNSYKYHIAVENYIHPHHWSDKISDPLLGLCLPFYAGDPCLGEVLPEESFIPIPIKEPEAALEIMQKAIRDNEYEKRLPAIREARRRIITKYNIFSQVAEVIRNHTPGSGNGGCILGRHRLRRNPLNALEEFAMLMRFRILQRVR